MKTVDEMGSELKQWVSDRLMVLLGFSSTTVVQYVIGLGQFLLFFPLFRLNDSMCYFGWYTIIICNMSSTAKKASSPADVLAELKKYTLLSSGEAFAEEIFARVPRKTSTENVSFCLNVAEKLNFGVSVAICLA